MRLTCDIKVVIILNANIVAEIDEKTHPNAKKALEFFRHYIASVEILKDNLVHKVYFCVSEDVSVSPILLTTP